MPSPEDCVTAADEDCDGLTPPCTGSILSGSTFSEAGEQMLHALAVTPDGRYTLSVAGHTGANFGPPDGALPHSGGWDAYLASFANDGQLLWTKHVGDDADQQFYDVCVDVQGDLLVTGRIDGYYTLGGEAFGPPAANVLLRLNAAGEEIWARSFAGSAGWAVRVAPGGDVVFAGELLDSANFGGETMAGDGELDGFVARFDADGNWLWDRKIAADFVLTRGVAVDPSGDVIVVGRYNGQIDFGQGPLPVSVGYQLFLARFDAAGNLSRVQTFPIGWGMANSVAVDAEGNVIVGGDLSGETDFGAGPHSASEGMFVAKFDSEGNALWSVSYDPGGVPSGAGEVAVDPFGNVLLSGYYRKSLDTPTPLSGAKDAVVIKLDPNGNFQWVRDLGGDYAEAFTVASDAQGNVFSAGRFLEDLDLGQGVVTAQGSDIFVVKLAP
jgi:hypothetical protein